LNADDRDFNFNFNAHEETIAHLEDQVAAVEKELMMFKERIDKEHRDALKLMKETREDCVTRLKEVYRGHNDLVDESQKVQ